MKLDEFLDRLDKAPDSVTFNDTIDLIDRLYTFSPTAFNNGALTNDPGQNNGSCKIFAFALMQGLGAQKTLHCFGDYYRKDVLKNPDGIDHQNIRNFMNTGWEGIRFSGVALKPKH